jgi:hypothetical protein
MKCLSAGIVVFFTEGTMFENYRIESKQRGWNRLLENIRKQKELDILLSEQQSAASDEATPKEAKSHPKDEEYE